MPLHLVWRGLAASGRQCTLCASLDVRRSGRRTPLLVRSLGLALCRRQACWQLFLLPSRVVKTGSRPALE